MSNPHLTENMSTEGPSPEEEGALPKDFFREEFLEWFIEVDQWIREEKKDELLKCVNDEKNPTVNLSGDLVLHVVIAYGKSELACYLIEKMQNPSPRLADMKNKITWDTALHVAASMGDEMVAQKLLETEDQLLRKQNRWKETPLHKAALYGHRRMFQMLENPYGVPHEKRDHMNILARTGSGNTFLHCAILSNSPELALYIAMHYPVLKESRNKDAVTPLQLLVTIPEVLRTNEQLSLLDIIIYKTIPVDEIDEDKLYLKDHENQNNETRIKKIYVHKSNNGKKYEMEPIGVVDQRRHRRIRARANFPKNYGVLFDIIDIVAVMWKGLVKILRARYSKIEELCSLKEKHKAYMKLIAFLAHKPSYWDFLEKGRSGGPGSVLVSSTGDASPLKGTSTSLHEVKTKEEEEEEKKKKKQKNNRWNESPLTLGAKMGLYEFVEQILKVCPVSSFVRDQDGHNILQVAIENGQDRIVDLIELMAYAPNPVLSSSWLTSAVSSSEGQSISHFAAHTTVNETYASPLQLRRELRWFKRVQKLLPTYLRYNRNNEDLTGLELFIKNHNSMLEKAKEELKKTGEMCSGLVAAVVFTSSFSIPGDKVNGKPMYMERVAFKVFSHAYVIGLSCASTALVLFLSFTVSQYREEDFESYIPTKYRFAAFSFVIALLALLVAFSCNIYLSIYGGEKVEAAQVTPFVCELLVLPTVFLLYLIIRGGKEYIVRWLF